MDIFVMRPFNAHTFFKGIDDIFMIVNRVFSCQRSFFLRITVLFANF